MKGWIRVKRTAPTTSGGILTRDEFQKLAEVQEWLGHANIATTRLYGYCTGVMSARRLVKAVEEQIAISAVISSPSFGRWPIFARTTCKSGKGYSWNLDRFYSHRQKGYCSSQRREPATLTESPSALAR